MLCSSYLVKTGETSRWRKVPEWGDFGQVTEPLCARGPLIYGANSNYLTALLSTQRLSSRHCLDINTSERKHPHFLRAGFQVQVYLVNC